ncbi:MAG: nucleoside triphosphate pyrophosphohydrolase [Candidatus Pacebacteria bacterium]|nr:nucleoside triphosphate pyrophosphohydrolase [Candidatus Paceibacterota bacterium]
MGRVYYNKLVRDRIQEKITGNGEACEIRAIEDDAEFQQELLKKVTEEATVLSHVRSREDFLSEYADLMVVLDTLTAHMDISEAEIRLALAENLEKKGGYSNRHYLHWSDDGDYKSNETPQGIQ